MPVRFWPTPANLPKPSCEAHLSQGAARTERRRLKELREDRPDLAELVSTEALSLEEARKQAAEETEAMIRPPLTPS